MKISGTSPHVPPARTTAHTDRAARMAMRAKARDIRNAEGESRPDPAPPPRDDEVTGSRVDRYA